MSQEQQYHNYVTGSDEKRSVPETDDEAIQYIPQTSVTQAMYWLRRREKGDTIHAALSLILGLVNASENKNKRTTGR